MVKAWLKWLLHVLWKLKASIFAQSLGKSGWSWPCYFKASIALLKIKENFAASKQMDCRLQAIIWRYLNSQKPLILSQSCTPLLGNPKTTIHFPSPASMFGSIFFLFFSHKSLVFKCFIKQFMRLSSFSFFQKSVASFQKSRKSKIKTTVSVNRV